MTTINVGTRAELLRAIGEARAGDVIIVAPGDYDMVGLRDVSFSSPLTIRSADPANMARFGQLHLNDVTGLAFEAIEIGRALGDGESIHSRMISITDSAGISFERVFVHGGIDGDPRNDGYGMKVIGSRDIAVRDSRFHEVSHGAVFQNSSGIDLVGNRFTDMRSDGAVFGAVSDVLVDRNHFTGFHLKPGDHADAIQFLTAGQPSASTDIRITNNVILQGDGMAAQGIWMRDEDKGLPFRNVLIANNLVYMNTWNGISVVGGGSDIIIVGNTVLADPKDKYRLRIRIGQVQDVRIEDNVAHNYLALDSSNVALAGNIFLNETPADAARIPKQDVGAAATVADLIIPGLGYDPPGQAGSTGKRGLEPDSEQHELLGKDRPTALIPRRPISWEAASIPRSETALAFEAAV